MERLTEREEGMIDVYLTKKKCTVLCGSDEYYEEISKLADYEDMEEQGRLVKLPCKDVWEKSGDTVYYISEGEIVECIHCGAEIDAEGKVVIGIATEDPIFPYREPDPEHDTDPTDWCKNFTHVLADEYGKMLFSDYKQAEQALNDMEL